MRMKPVRRRESADRDIASAADCYARRAGEKVALKYIDAVKRTINQISRNPEIGSPRYGDKINRTGLRQWQVSGFANFICYIDLPGYVLIIRVLEHEEIPRFVI